MKTREGLVETGSRFPDQPDGRREAVRMATATVGRMACYLLSALAFGSLVALLAWLVYAVIANPKPPSVVAELVGLFFVSGFLGTWAGALADSGTIVLPYFVARRTRAGSTLGGHTFALGTLGDALSGGIIALAASTLIRGILVPNLDHLTTDNVLALVTVGVLSGLGWKQLATGLRGWLANQIAHISKKTEELETKLTVKEHQIVNLQVTAAYERAVASLRAGQVHEALGFVTIALERQDMELDRRLLLECLKGEILASLGTSDAQREALEIMDRVVEAGDNAFAMVPVKRAGYRISRAIVMCHIDPDNPQIYSDLEAAVRLEPNVIGSLRDKARDELRAVSNQPWFSHLIEESG